MNILTVKEGGLDTPECQCSVCEMTFFIYWRPSVRYHRPDYCPFCGIKITDVIYIEYDTRHSISSGNQI
jgi:hypothetical protein